VPVLPHGASTSLAGQAVGAALVINCSRYLRGLQSAVLLVVTLLSCSVANLLHASVTTEATLEIGAQTCYTARGCAALPGIPLGGAESRKKPTVDLRSGKHEGRSAP
jgi:hypothetical protein